MPTTLAIRNKKNCITVLLRHIIILKQILTVFTSQGIIHSFREKYFFINLNKQQLLRTL